MSAAVGVGVWAESMSPRAVRASLGALAEAHARLCMSLPASSIGDASFAALTREAARVGVPVRAWLLLAEAEGYWIGTRNSLQAARAIERLLEWSSAGEGPKLEGVSLDLEPELGTVERARRGGVSAALGLARELARGLDRAAHDEATATLACAVEQLKERGLTAHCVTYPMVLDQPAGCEALEDALGINVSGIEWDEISIMVYETVFQQLLGFRPGPSLVHAYARAARERWGERAGLDLGVVGVPGVALDPGGRYASPAFLRDDLAAVCAAGIPLERVRVYGLAGILQQGGVTRWLDTMGLEPRAPAESRAVTGLRAGVALVARVLEQMR